MIDHFCEDLLLASHGEWLGSAAIDATTRRRLFAEVQSAALGAEVRSLCEAVMLCDGHLADGETMVVEAARHHWKLVDAEEPSATKVAYREAA